MDWLLRYADPSIDWNYAMVTLVVRFIGVFIVMAVVQVALQAASVVVRRIEAPDGREEAPALVSLELSAMAAHEAELDGPAVAAIALALSLEEQQQAAARRSSSPAAAGKPSAWAMAGRLRGLR